jgi:TonB family protein
MNPTATEPRGWSRRRWGTTIGLALAGQLLLIFLLSERIQPRSGRPPAPSRFRLLGGPSTPLPWSQAPWLSDAAQFALVSPQGFSGPVWQQLPRFGPQVVEWSEPPRWLTQEVSRLGSSFTPGSDTGGWLSRVTTERPAPGLSGLPALTAPMSTNSTLTIEGELGARRLLSALALAGWPHHDVLLPSTVQVVVNPQGLVISATLLGSSGLAAADQRALELARAARFQPLSSPTQGLGLSWGRLVFEWQAVELAGTNLPPARGAP